MRKIITCIFLLFTTCHCLFAQIIYRDKESGQEYLFIGGVYDNQVKLMNLKNKSVTWLNKANVQQTNQLTPGAFLQTIFASNLFFHADGIAHVWQAMISKKRLQINLPDGTQKELKIQINLDDNPLDRAFVFMFQSENRQTYGLVRELSIDSPCLINNDGTNIFEVFINYQGQVIRGCAYLDTKDVTALYPFSLK